MRTPCAKALWWDSTPYVRIRMKASVAGVERAKGVGRTLWALKEFCPYLFLKIS